MVGTIVAESRVAEDRHRFRRDICSATPAEDYALRRKKLAVRLDRRVLLVGDLLSTFSVGGRPRSGVGGVLSTDDSASGIPSEGGSSCHLQIGLHFVAHVHCSIGVLNTVRFVSQSFNNTRFLIQTQRQFVIQTQVT